jgi:DNA helicase-2/ATP-dependent DNA helicase PcrA
MSETLQNYGITDIPTDKQNEIIYSDHKKIKVIASPGSGKTFTVIMRYLHLVLIKSFNPQNIILITFTKKAGEELKNRIKKYSNQIKDEPFHAGSIHSLAHKMIKTELHILDDKEPLEIIISLMTGKNYNFKPDNVMKYYELYNTTYPPSFDNIKNEPVFDKYCDDIIDVINQYYIYKEENEYLDFNDLLQLFCKYLKTKDGKKFIKNVKYIFFDEFQDINPIQYYILEQFKCNKMIVGDDNQSIYKFRGSNIDFIFNYKSTHTYYLDENFRSTSSIVDFCEDLIKKNSQKFEKNVISATGKKGKKPIINIHNTNDEQNIYICKQILELNKQNKKCKNMAILARNNKSLDMIELMLAKYEIDYIRPSETLLLRKDHTKFLIAFLCITNKCQLNIHYKRLMKALKIPSKDNIKEKHPELYEKLQSLTDITYKDNLEGCIEYTLSIFDVSVKNDLELIKQEALKYTDIQLFLDDFKLNDIEVDVENKNCVTLTTFHGSKGLEWSYVFIIDYDKSYPKVFGNKVYIDQLKEYEEERRVLYVATTRAKKYLYINGVKSLSMFVTQIKKDKYTSSSTIKENTNYDCLKDIEYKYLDLPEIVCNNTLQTNDFMRLLIMKFIGFDLELVHNYSKLPKDYINDYNNYTFNKETLKKLYQIILNIVAHKKIKQNINITKSIGDSYYNIIKEICPKNNIIIDNNIIKSGEVLFVIPLKNELEYYQSVKTVDKYIKLGLKYRCNNVYIVNYIVGKIIHLNL